MSEPYYASGGVTVHAGDCLDVLAGLPDASVDAVVTDPPYNLSFMGREWDTFPIRKRGQGGTGIHSEHAGGVEFKMTCENSHGFQRWCELWTAECLRVLKPGGHLLAMGGTRTWHRLACAVEDAGFEVRDSIAWMYGSGFPKSLDVSKAIDKAAGAEREVVGMYASPEGTTGVNSRDDDFGFGVGDMSKRTITAPATPDAQRWQGWGTALKPAHEPVVVARKPLIGTIAQNVLAHGTGALNIDATRIRPDGGLSPRAVVGEPSRGPELCTCAGRLACSNGDTGPAHESSPLRHTPSRRAGGPAETPPARRNGPPANAPQDAADRLPPRGSPDDCQPSPRSGDAPARETGEDAQASPLPPRGADTSPDRCASCGCIRSIPTTPYDHSTAPHVQRLASAGRWPANVVLDEDQADALDQQSGESTSPTSVTRGGNRAEAYGMGRQEDMPCFGDSGGASRFFYTAKADAGERVRIDGIAHPTVKPLDLMRWLVRLVTPPGGVVLEPFAGSGTTVEACILEGFGCIAIEREADYLPLIVQRINRRRDPVAAVKAAEADGGLFDLLADEDGAA